MKSKSKSESVLTLNIELGVVSTHAQIICTKISQVIWLRNNTFSETHWTSQMIFFIFLNLNSTEEMVSKFGMKKKVRNPHGVVANKLDRCQRVWILAESASILFSTVASSDLVS